MPRLLRPLLAACLATLAALLAAPVADAARTAYRGVNTHGLRTSVAPATATRELDAIKSAGGDTVRMDLGWASLEETGKGQWSSKVTAQVDAVLDAAAQRRLSVVVTFLSTPCWASSAPATVKQSCAAGWWDRGVAKYPPTNAADYADAVEYVLRRWGSRIAALEVWNEPNTDATWITPDKAGAYVRLLGAAYTRAKQVDKSVRILGGAIAGADTNFLQALYAAGFAGRQDGISFHPYTNHDPGAVVVGEDPTRSYVLGVPRMQDVASAHGEGGKGLWLTESGFSSCTNLAICVTEADQAHHVNALFRIAEGWPYVKALLVYDLRNDGTDPAAKEQNFGLLRADFSAKPAYASFADAMARRFVS
jgi:hypothetical protein